MRRDSCRGRRGIAQFVAKLGFSDVGVEGEGAEHLNRNRTEGLLRARLIFWVD